MSPEENNKVLKAAPVALFCFNRLDVLKSTLSSLENNILAPETELFIFSDGPRSIVDAEKVSQVRQYLRRDFRFRKISIIERETNLGLAKSIIEGVSLVLDKHKSIIVLEDDLVTSKNFLVFMNSALNFYESDSQMLSISGYTPPISKTEIDAYITQRASSWGWATWRDRWNEVSWTPDYDKLKSVSARREFNKMGSDLCKMLNDYKTGKIDSWAIRFVFHQFNRGLYTIYPTRSKVQNIGFSSDATHTKGFKNRYATSLDSTLSTRFHFMSKPEIDKQCLAEFTRKYALRSRVKYKVLRHFSSLWKG